MDESIEVLEQRFRKELERIEVRALADAGLHESLYDLVHRYCEIASMTDVPPEKVLRRLKEVITDRFGLAIVQDGLFAKDLVWRAVRRCITAYYAAKGVTAGESGAES